MRAAIIAITVMSATSASAQTMMDWSAWTTFWGSQSLAFEAARNTLADPESAQIINLHRPKNQWSTGTCGAINAKGRLGGRAGYVNFYANPENKRLELEQGLYNPEYAKHGC